MNYLDRIKAVVGDHVGKPASDIDTNAAFASESDRHAAKDAPQYLGLDSLDRVELAMKVEEHFSIDIPDEDMTNANLSTVAGLATYVEEKWTPSDHVVDAVKYMMGGQRVGKTHKREVERLIGVDAGGETSEPNYVDMSAGDFAAAVGFDAKLWTDAFMQIACFNNPLGRSMRQFPHGDRTELGEVMFGWFANAIMAGHDYARNNPALIDGSGVDGVSFTKKPVTIEAVEFVGLVDGAATFNRSELPEWLIDALSKPEATKGAIWIDYAGEALTLNVGTLEGAHVASAGDWIIRGVKGEVYPCKPDIFAMTYDPEPVAGTLELSEDDRLP